MSQGVALALLTHKSEHVRPVSTAPPWRWTQGFSVQSEQGLQLLNYFHVVSEMWYVSSPIPRGASGQQFLFVSFFLLLVFWKICLVLHRRLPHSQYLTVTFFCALASFIFSGIFNDSPHFSSSPQIQSQLFSAAPSPHNLDIQPFFFSVFPLDCLSCL